MAKLQILRYPDPRLHTVARQVAQVDDRIRRLVDDMLETMYDAEGVGLAATQVDVHQRVIVMDTSDTHDQPRVLINPEIVSASDELLVNEEGCLSVPTIYDKVQRHARVRVRALGRDGGAVDPALALPRYLRDKVAQTTAERDAARLAKAAAA